MTSTVRVLIIDDDPEYVGILTDFLGDSTREQYIPDGALTVAEAIEKLKVQSYDLILLDQQLPDRTGLEALVEIQQRTTSPIIMVTGHRQKGLQNQVLDAGVVDYLEKSQLNSELLRHVAALAVRQTCVERVINPILVSISEVAEQAQTLQQLQAHILEEIQALQAGIEQNLDIIRQDIKEQHGSIRDDVQNLSKFRWLLNWIVANPRTSILIFAGVLVIGGFGVWAIQHIDSDKAEHLKSLFD